jgi:hypothetical protein
MKPSTALFASVVGCAGMIVLAIVAVVGLFFLARAGMDAKTPAIAEALQEDFDFRLASTAIPEERVEIMTSLVDLATDEDISYTMIIMCSKAYRVGVEPQSGMTDEERYAIVQAVVEFVSEDPGAGFIAMGMFMVQHPSYEDIFANLDKL